MQGPWHEARLLNPDQGVHAVFGLTNFWEHLFKGFSAKDAGELEEQQGVNIAIAASQTATLEHYIWSTVVPASKVTNGKHPVPHSDYKAGVDLRIRMDFSELALKTTFLYVGFYPTNLVYYPQLKPIPLVSLAASALNARKLTRMQASGKYIWPQPVRPTATIPMAGVSSHRVIYVVFPDLPHCLKSKPLVLWNSVAQSRTSGRN